MQAANNNMYTIKQNDTLWDIAGGDAAKIKKICEANNIKDANSIFAGATLDLSCLSGNTGNLKPGDEFVSDNSESGDKSIGQQYRTWIDSEDNANKLLSKKGDEIPEFEAFHFDRNEVKDKSVDEQAKTYLDKMGEFAKSIISSADEGEKDEKLDLNEYIKLSSGNTYDEKMLKEAYETIKKYDTVDDKGNKTSNGKIEKEELVQYVKDKYGKDIGQINLESINEESAQEFKKYAEELTDILSKSQHYEMLSKNFSNISQLDGDDKTISKEEFSALLTTHDIDWNQLNSDSSKKVLDVVDGKINYSTTQTFVSNPSNNNYSAQTNYLKELFNGLFGKKQPEQAS